MADQLITYGIVEGFDNGNPHFARITDGVFTVVAYIPFSSPAVQVGKAYTVYKQGSTYFVGTEVTMV